MIWGLAACVSTHDECRIMFAVIGRCQERNSDLQLLQEIRVQDGGDGCFVPQCWTDYSIGRLRSADNKVVRCSFCTWL